MPVPDSFREAVAAAMAAGRPGDLRLLSWEIHDLPWAEEGQYLAASAKLEAEAGRPPGRVLLFAAERLPPDGAPAARRAIAQAIHADEQELGRARLGIAGAGAGELLFHELCAERGIATQIYLPQPVESFVERELRPAGGDWEERGRRLLERLPVHVLSGSLPPWLAGKKEPYDVGLRHNRRMLHNAFAEGGDEVAILALWRRGEEGGLTGDLVTQALERGATPHLFDLAELFGR